MDLLTCSDIGWSEILVIAIVVIVVVGPKDLPPMLRAFGKTMARCAGWPAISAASSTRRCGKRNSTTSQTIANDLQGLNPLTRSREALNPLGKIGQDISSGSEEGGDGRREDREAESVMPRRRSTVPA